MPESKKTILVVEDNPANQKLVVDLLEYNGFLVLSALDANQALATLATTTPDLILLDINLPRVSGLELFKLIRNLPELSGVTVVALTALAMRDDKDKILGLGFDGYISKPIDTREFVATVKRLIAEPNTTTPGG